MKVGVVTLGCDKNTVDSERYVASLADRGAEYTPNLEDAEIILVNTCGFIDAAKKESIDALVEAGRLKETGQCRAVVGIGCMVQRHKDELIEALPEVDLFLGSSEVDRLIPELEERGLLSADEVPALHPGVRLFAGGLPHVRYLKISEGCDHGCAFCAIPLMRGKHRSFALDEIVREAQLLEAQGARELNLVAQDLAHYGRDLRGEALGLPDVLQALLRETTIPWIRMLYVYSAGLTPRVLELMATEQRIVPYLDMPIQHGSDAVLARMRRPERQRTIRERVTRTRDTVPDLAIRTTCIVGFPGETEQDFETLLAFLEEIQFDRVGAFTYSPQEGTRAAAMDDDVPESVKLERLERLNELQRLITAERYEARVGRTVRALVDRVDDELTQARTVWQADDIDGVTYIAGGAGVAPGSFVDVRLDAVVDDVDFAATFERVVSAPVEPVRRARMLPVMAAGGGEIDRKLWPMTSRSREIMRRAAELFPGGVNSPVRAFRGVGGDPFVVERGKGPRIWDVDGNEYLDYVLSWGPLVHGHAPPRVIAALEEAMRRGTSFGIPTEAEVRLAEAVVQRMPHVEMLRFVSSGTEATMSAIRLARAFTDRDVVLKFDGCYHGHADSFLVRAGSGVATLGLANSPGVPGALASLTVVAPFNDLDAVETLLRVNQVAAIIVEPVVGNAGFIPPDPKFLPGLRDLATRHGALLIFDEVMTGFRIALGGARERFGVTADLTTLGKVIGGGLPVAAYGGRRELMDLIAPSGAVYQAGTLSGNPLAMAAGLATLDELTPDVQESIAMRTARLVQGLRASAMRHGLPFTADCAGSMWGFFFRAEPVRSFADAKTSDVERFKRFFHAALDRGVYLAPSAFEAAFMSSAHDDAVVDTTLERLDDAMRGAK